ncbi:MAG: hypothetical protein DI629_12255 [Mesorhizobium amorphae]|nr:MAG: hypothetical protein DI629_12255 [Mesorhizobium amorphae]
MALAMATSDHGLRAENARLHSAVFKLEGQVELLREALGFDAANALQSVLDLRPSGARILAMLSTGRICSFAQISAGLAFDRRSDEPCNETIRVHVSRLRRDLERTPVVIGNAPSTGYVLRAGRELVLDIMAGRVLG